MATAQQLYAFTSDQVVYSYHPDLLVPLFQEIEMWLLGQVEDLAPQYRAASVPLIARIEQTGMTLRVSSGSEKGACTLAELVLTGGWEGVPQKLELKIHGHDGLSMDPSYLESLARRAKFVNDSGLFRQSVA